MFVSGWLQLVRTSGGSSSSYTLRSYCYYHKVMEIWKDVLSMSNISNISYLILLKEIVTF